MKRTGGFTLVELLVVVAIIALLVTILLPTLGRVTQLAEQATCMSNLSGISKGWGLYANDNNRFPPILPDIGAVNSVGPGPGYNAWCESLSMGSECTVRRLGMGGQQNLCLLVKGGFVPWGIFLCPSSGNTEASGRGQANRKYGLGETVNGTEKGYCDYAIQAPYRYGRGGNRNRCPISKYMDGGIVILGDKGVRWYYYTQAAQWSGNHPDDGAAVLYVSGAVRFSRDEVDNDPQWGVVRNTCGWGENCIYLKGRWDTSDPDDPKLLYRGVTGAGGWGGSSRDTVLWWWPEARVW